MPAAVLSHREFQKLSKVLNWNFVDQPVSKVMAMNFRVPADRGIRYHSTMNDRIRGIQSIAGARIAKFDVYCPAPFSHDDFRLTGCPHENP